MKSLLLLIVFTAVTTLVSFGQPTVTITPSADPITFGASFTATVNLTNAQNGNRTYNFTITCDAGCGSETCTINTSNGSGNAGSCVVSFTAPASGASITLTATSTSQNCTPSCVASSSPTLPVELVSFKATSKKKTVQLEWSTALERNNEFFQVEHSRDGLNFNSIGKVKGEGTTSETIAYDFMHRQPIAGANYYRLKQVDFDGAFEYSNIVVAVLTNRTGGVQVYPNPTINKATISMNERPENIKFLLSNLLGQGIDLQPNQVDAGWELDLSNLANGIYVLRMEYDGNLITKRIVKE